MEIWLTQLSQLSQWPPHPPPMVVKSGEPLPAWTAAATSAAAAQAVRGRPREPATLDLTPGTRIKHSLTGHTDTNMVRSKQRGGERNRASPLPGVLVLVLKAELLHMPPPSEEGAPLLRCGDALTALLPPDKDMGGGQRSGSPSSPQTRTRHKYNISYKGKSFFLTKIEDKERVISPDFCLATF